MAISVSKCRTQHGIIIQKTINIIEDITLNKIIYMKLKKFLMVIPCFQIISLMRTPLLTVMSTITNPDLKYIDEGNILAKNIIGTITYLTDKIYDTKYENVRQNHKVRVKTGTYDHGLGVYRFEQTRAKLTVTVKHATKAHCAIANGDITYADPGRIA